MALSLSLSCECLEVVRPFEAHLTILPNAGHTQSSRLIRMWGWGLKAITAFVLFSFQCKADSWVNGAGWDVSYFVDVACGQNIIQS